MDVKDIDEILQYGIESFLRNRPDKARMYFTIVLANDPENDVARFGMMCIDALADGMSEARDMFGVYAFASPRERELIREMFEGYSSGAFYGANTTDVLTELLGGYHEDDDYTLDDLGVDAGDSQEAYNSDFLLAKVYEKIGNYDKAIDYIAKAFKLKPFDEKLKKELLKIVRKKNGKR